uniref:Reverse transcriptase Ty1/copia-type domain-containing protein n=1 Tax=Tanacetum cinerariifolium TaxID=118510 RepID=A0A6L2K1H9_TANCI|nr:hypothetical protein [Tanacetum cinerariifolium]
MLLEQSDAAGTRRRNIAKYLIPPQVMSAAKLPILNPNKFNLWKMSIEQYFLMTDYSLWERLERKNELKARGTLLMALPNKHQLKFNIHKDAKTFMEAIEKLFGGNKETKKVQKTLLKQQYENFTGSSSESLDQIHDRLQNLISQLEILGESLSQEDINLKFLRSLPTEWRTHSLIWRNKTNLEEQSLNDLFKSLKIYEAEVKSSSSARTSTQNNAFMSSSNTNSTNEPVSVAASVSAVSAKIYVSALPNVDTLSNVVIYSFFASQSTSQQLDNDDLKQIDRTGWNLRANGPTSMGFDMSKVESYNSYMKGHFTRKCRSPKDTRRNGAADPQKRNVLVETSTSNALVSQCDGVDSYDWSFQAEEEPTNYAFMAFTSLSSSFDNEIVSCSKACTKAYATLHLPPSPIYDRYQSKNGYHVVPLPYTGIFMPPKPDLVFHNALVNNKTVYIAFNVELSPTKPENDLSHTHRPSAPIIKDWVSDSEDESETKIPQNVLSFVQPTKQVKSPRPSFQHVETSIPTANPKIAILKPTSNGNHRNRKSKLVPINAARPVTVAVPKPHVTRPRPAKPIVTKPYSPPRRHNNRSPSPKSSCFPLKVTAVKVLQGNPQHALKDKGVIDSGCLRHMTGNMSYLSDFEELNGGYVAFGGNPNGGKIFGKDATFEVKELEFEGSKPQSEVHVSPSSSAQSKKHDDKTKREAKGKSPVESSTRYRNLSTEFEYFFDNIINEDNVVVSLVSTVGQISTNSTITFSAAGPSNAVVKADFNNLETSITVGPIPTTRVHKDHPVTQIIGDLSLATQTRIMTRVAKDQGGATLIQNAEGLVLVDLPHGKRDLCTKWVFRNKKDERGIVDWNKAQLVAERHTQGEGIDYEEFFALVARIETIRLLLAYASFMGFMVYQMDVKSAFLYGTIKKEVYVCQPLGFEDPDYPDKVYKVVKALYGLHQAPRAWYETLANYLLENSFQRGKIDLCKAFEKLMKEKFQMSSIGELTFFLGLQVKQKKDGIFISQDKYVAKILRKFGLTDGKSASTPKDTEKPLLKDLDVKRIFRYLKGKPHLGLWYPKDSPFNLVAYSDSDYAGASLDKKSTTGGCQFLGCTLISWKEKEDNVVKRYQALKRKPQTKAQAKKNMMIYLRNVVGFKMDYFKGMTYDDIRPIFEKKFNSNVAFLQKTMEQMEEEHSRALKRLSESQEDKAVKKQNLDEEVEELRKHLQIVPNNDDDVYTEATPLALKVPVVDYEIHTENNKPYYKIKIADRSHQLYLKRRYPLTRFTLDQMLNNVRLEVEEDSDVSLELLRFIRQQQQEGFMTE